MRGRGHRAGLVAFGAFATAAFTPLATVAAKDGQAPSLQSRVVFDIYPPEARADALSRRFLSPLTFAALSKGLARTHQTMRQEQVTLRDEHFMLVVPETMPDDGYGVLVFIPPWSDARLPNGWKQVLNRMGLIFVSADRSGNEESILARREPLALIAAANIAQRFKVNRDRVFIGGFSGGSRVALRVALAFPDIFRGALLNAGSDPIGDLSAPLPDKSLFRLFQERTRIALVTGALDATNQEKDAEALAALRQHCVDHVTMSALPGVDHDPAPAAALSSALRLLSAPPDPDGAGRNRCRLELDQHLSDDLASLEQASATGNSRSTERRLTELDKRYGWLAATALLHARGVDP